MPIREHVFVNEVLMHKSSPVKESAGNGEMVPITLGSWEKTTEVIREIYEILDRHD